MTRPPTRQADCDHDPAHPWAHSWTADGRRVCWRPALPPGTAVAVDAELADQPVPPSLHRRHPVAAEQFWRDWTRTEVAAKLAGIPVLVWIARYGFTAGQGRTWRHDDLVVSAADHVGQPLTGSLRSASDLP